MNNPIKRARNVFQSLELNLISFLSIISTAIEFRPAIREMEHAISTCPLSVYQMNVQQWFVKIVTAILRLEIQGLTDRQTGLHMHAKSLKVEQFEKGRIGFLKPLYEQKALRTWTVLRQLLDVPPKSGKRRKAD